MIRPYRILKTSSYHIISIEHFALRMQGWATSTWEVIHKGMVTRDHRRSRTLGDFKQERQNNHWWVLSRRAVELRPKNPLIDVWVGSQKIRGLPRLQRHRMYKSNQSRATEWKSRIISIYSNGPFFFLQQWRIMEPQIVLKVINIHQRRYRDIAAKLEMHF